MSEQSRYLAILQVGPVQEFIQTAKKTTDYWSGSFILSYFCAIAIKTVGEENVIFPSVEPMETDPIQLANPLYIHVKNTPGLPWTGTAQDNNIYRPSLPNRLLCLFQGTAEPKEALSRAAKEIRSSWQNMQEIVLRQMESIIEKEFKHGKKGIDPVWRGIWKRQVESPFEILYVWHPWPVGPNEMEYKHAYRKIESLMGSRKAVRWFESEPPEEGHKCSLCGVREALHLDGSGAGREQIRSNWNEVVRLGKLKHRFREGECLCAVCTVKRLAPKLVFNNDLDSPSTSTIACATTVRDLLDDDCRQKALACGKDLIALSGSFTARVKDAAVAADEPKESDPVPANVRKPKELAMDGHWLQTDFYQKLAQKPPKTVPADVKLYLKKLKEAETALRDLLGGLEAAKKATETPFIFPSKYFAVLLADGDDMGKVLGDMESIEKHKVLSRHLARFSVKHAFEALQEDNLGYVVYFGGDEGAAFVTLENLFPAMRMLKESWDQMVMSPLRDQHMEAPTLSAGACISHYQDGLRGTIESAHRALEEAKAIDGKDGFSITVNRRSGGTFVCRSKWCFGEEDNRLPVMALLEELVKGYRCKLISPDWINDLRGEAKAVGDPVEEIGEQESLTARIEDSAHICGSEIERLVKRHSFVNPVENAFIGATIEKLKKLNMRLTDLGGYINRNRFRDFINLMDAAQYVAKGGGR